VSATPRHHRHQPTRTVTYNRTTTQAHDLKSFLRSARDRVHLPTVIGQTREVNRSGSTCKTLCPFHDDHDPSLVLYSQRYWCPVCRASGELLDWYLKAESLPFREAITRVAEAAGLAPPALRARAGRRRRAESPTGQGKDPAGGGDGSVTPPRSIERSNGSGLTLEQYSEAKGLDLAKLRDCRLTTITYEGAPAVRMPYRDENGNELDTARFRVALSGDRIRSKSGAKLCLYGLWRLRDAREAGYIILCEGESDCHTLWQHGLPAIGLPGAGTWKEQRDAGHLEGIERVDIVIEPDTGGEAVRRWLSTSSIRLRAWLLDFGDFKDLSGLYLDDPSQFRERLEQARAAAVPWMVNEQEQCADAAAAAYEEARELLHDPKLLDLVRVVITAGGYAGNTDRALLVYMTGTSRLLERPVNLALIAQSAAGKNATVDAGLGPIPPEELYRFHASTERAPIYSGESYEHRVIVIAEADSIPEDGPAAAAIRSIADDNRMIYDVVEKDPVSGQFVTRRIEKEGPTGLITTSTKSLPHQMNTRTMEAGVPDDEEQTGHVTLQEARQAAGLAGDPPDLAPFHALQRWLRDGGAREVVVPFALDLQALIPKNQVRMRRDFKKILAFIQASGLLHQCQRDRDGRGRVIAILADYGNIRELLAPVLDAVIADGVTPAMRETVAAVPEEGEISNAELGRRLGLTRSTISWRVGRCMDAGWLVNNETQRGRQARIGRGVPLPEERHTLPTVEELEECARAREAANHSNVRYSSGEGYPPSPPAQLEPSATRATGGPQSEAKGERGDTTPRGDVASLPPSQEPPADAGPEVGAAAGGGNPPTDPETEQLALPTLEAPAEVTDRPTIPDPPVVEVSPASGNGAPVPRCFGCGRDDGVVQLDDRTWACNHCERTFRTNRRSAAEPGHDA
jgi:hypothetical protein